MLKIDIGSNAGIIWNLLSEKGELSVRELGELTNFKDHLISMALGWLSREDKIVFTDTNGILHIQIKDTYTEIYY